MCGHRSVPRNREEDPVARDRRISIATCLGRVATKLKTDRALMAIGDQTAINVIKVHGNLVCLAHGSTRRGPGRCNRLAVDNVPGSASQSFTHVLLVRRVQLARLTYIDGHSKTRMGIRRRGLA